MFLFDRSCPIDICMHATCRKHVLATTVIGSHFYFFIAHHSRVELGASNIVFLRYYWYTTVKKCIKYAVKLFQNLNLIKKISN